MAERAVNAAVLRAPSDPEEAGLSLSVAVALARGFSCCRGTLRRVSLLGWRFDGKNALRAVLCGLQGCVQLEELEMLGCAVVGGRGQRRCFGKEVSQALLQDRPSTLRHLSLRSCGLSADGCLALLRSAALQSPPMLSLDLRGNAAEGLEAESKAVWQLLLSKPEDTSVQLDSSALSADGGPEEDDELAEERESGKLPLLSACSPERESRSPHLSRLSRKRVQAARGGGIGGAAAAATPGVLSVRIREAQLFFRIAAASAASGRPGRHWAPLSRVLTWGEDGMAPGASDGQASDGPRGTAAPPLADGSGRLSRRRAAKVLLRRISKDYGLRGRPPARARRAAAEVPTQGPTPQLGGLDTAMLRKPRQPSHSRAKQLRPNARLSILNGSWNRLPRHVGLAVRLGLQPHLP
mmetsp:Transcript_20302/g.66188  ORF Transcript_20302/g.66188 Transcript_20302/m.66188 type:complete len:409 (+) Transcript_20302:423-1649(+)